jgi:hypothetical protein
MEESRMAAGFHPKRLFRFSIGMMLFAMLCISGYLGAHRAGQKAGANALYDVSFHTKVHNLSDLVIDQPNQGARDKLFEEIRKSLQTTVAPESWASTGANGEMCDIQPFPAAASLIISQRGAVQVQIDAALQAYRDRQLKAHTDKVVAEIERLAADEQTGPVVLSQFPQNEPLALAAVELRYENAVRNLTERWGASHFSGACTDAGFPLWSVAQSIATWPKNGGEAYLAVQDFPEAGRVLLVGWRPRD